MKIFVLTLVAEEHACREEVAGIYSSLKHVEEKVRGMFNTDEYYSENVSVAVGELDGRKVEEIMFFDLQADDPDTGDLIDPFFVVNNKHIWKEICVRKELKWESS